MAIRNNGAGTARDALCFIVALLGLGIAAFRFFDIGPFPADEPQKPFAHVKCMFDALPNQGAIKLGFYTGPLAEMEVSGNILRGAEPSDESLMSHDWKAHATYQIEGRRITANARGSVFLNRGREVQALFMAVEDRNFAADGSLRLATLNKDGQLDEDHDGVYIWTIKEFRLAHPMSMKCNVGEPVEEMSWLEKILARD